MPRITTLADLLLAELGIATVSVETSAQAGVSTALLMRQDGNRVAWILQNLSVNNLYIRPERAPLATAGIVLAPNEWRSMIWREDLDLVGREWQILAAGAASDYLLLETRLLGGGGGAP